MKRGEHTSAGLRLRVGLWAAVRRVRTERVMVRRTSIVAVIDADWFLLIYSSTELGRLVGDGYS